MRTSAGDLRQAALQPPATERALQRHERRRRARPGDRRRLGRRRGSTSASATPSSAIRGESHPFAATRTTTALGQQPASATTGLCGEELQEGDEVAAASSTAATPSRPVRLREPARCTPLELRAPATGSTGAPVDRHRGRYDAQGRPSPVEGARVTAPASTPRRAPTAARRVTLRARPGRSALKADAAGARALGRRDGRDVTGAAAAAAAPRRSRRPTPPRRSRASPASAAASASRASARRGRCAARSRRTRRACARSSSASPARAAGAASSTRPRGSASAARAAGAG